MGLDRRIKRNKKEEEWDFKEFIETLTKIRPFISNMEKVCYTYTHKDILQYISKEEKDDLKNTYEALKDGLDIVDDSLMMATEYVATAKNKRNDFLVENMETVVSAQTLIMQAQLAITLIGPISEKIPAKLLKMDKHKLKGDVSVTKKD